MLHEQPFESAVFGRPVARIALANGFDPSALALDLAEAQKEWSTGSAWLVSCRIPSTDIDAAAILTSAGFEKVETLVTFEHLLNNDVSDTHGTTLGGPDSADPSVEIARTAFHDDRFHRDKRVPKDGADELKARWVANSFAGRADAIVVRHENERVVGFCACLYREPHAVIDLIATAPDAQGRGHGHALVTGALTHYTGRAQTMRVGTQLDNHRSRKLYVESGFAEISRADTFHWVAT